MLLAGAIYALSWRRGVQGARLILVGIAVGAMLDSVISYAMTRAGVYDANEALRWLTGSLNSAFWPVVGPLALATAVLVPALLVLSRHLAALQLGDDTAAALGVRPDRARLSLIDDRQHLIFQGRVGGDAVASGGCHCPCPVAVNATGLN